MGRGRGAVRELRPCEARVKAYRVLLPDGREIGRILGRSEEDALKDAREIFRRTDITVQLVAGSA